MADLKRAPSFAGGLLCSFLLHIALAVAALLVLQGRVADASRLVPVYTVTLEAGSKLGGVSQAPKKSEKKRVLTKESAPEPKAEEPVESKQVEKTPVKEEAPEPEPPVEAKPDQDLVRAKREEAAKKEAAEKKLVAKKKAEEKRKREKLEAEKKKKDAAEAKKKAELEKKRKKKQQEAKLRKLKKQKAEQEKKDREARFADTIRKARQKAYQGESASAGGEGYGAARLGGQGMGGGTLASAEFIAYMNALESHIKAGWRWSYSRKLRLKTVVLMRISPTGAINNASISRPSGNSQFDDSVIRAVRKSSPVPRAPSHLYDQFREVRITFDSDSV